MECLMPTVSCISWNSSFDYMMIEDRYMIEHAHEIHTLAKDLKICSKEILCVLPDKFVAGGIISKLPPF